jgi:hypothetical protein
VNREAKILAEKNLTIKNSAIKNSAVKISEEPVPLINSADEYPEDWFKNQKVFAWVYRGPYLVIDVAVDFDGIKFARFMNIRNYWWVVGVTENPKVFLASVWGDGISPTEALQTAIYHAHESSAGMGYNLEEFFLKVGETLEDFLLADVEKTPPNISSDGSNNVQNSSPAEKSTAGCSSDWKRIMRSAEFVARVVAHNQAVLRIYKKFSSRR